jgi:hypothetical protein
VVLVGASAAMFASGCGGGKKQDAGEATHTYKVQILSATFNPNQAVARPAVLRVKLRNADARTIPNLAVTVDSFYYTENYPELAANKRPVWVVEQGPGKIPARPVQSQAISPPGGGQTAYVNTWALGPLAPGRAQTFEWTVSPVKVGPHKVHIEIAAGLAGRAKATLANGARPTATFAANIAPAPPATYVNPSTGKVVAGTYPVKPYTQP